MLYACRQSARRASEQRPFAPVWASAQRSFKTHCELDSAQCANDGSIVSGSDGGKRGETKLFPIAIVNVVETDARVS